jgi:ADP-ribose pyrophosphatase YjhB (NUDIX family)
MVEQISSRVVYTNHWMTVREDEARTELAEETGLRAESMRFLARLDNSHGLSTQSMHVFGATGLTAGEPAREVTEQDMRQKWLSRADFEQVILHGKITDASSVAAYDLYRLRPQELSRLLMRPHDRGVHADHLQPDLPTRCGLGDQRVRQPWNTPALAQPLKRNACAYTPGVDIA